MKHFNTYIQEFLIKGHTKYIEKSNIYSIFDMVDPHCIGKKSDGDAIYVYDRPVSFDNGTTIRPWVYIWRHIYDNQPEDSTDLLSWLDSTRESIGIHSKDVSTFGMIQSMCDASVIKKDKNDKYIAILPKDWPIL